jgi:cell division protein FtsW (lipid II flippase)
MAVTRVRREDRAKPAPFKPAVPQLRRLELILLAGALAIIACGLILASRARLLEAEAATKSPIALHALERPQQLYPALAFIESPTERDYIAQRIHREATDSRLPNVGALSRLRVPLADAKSTRLPELRTRALAIEKTNAQRVARKLEPITSVSLLTGEDLRNFKPQVVVRSPSEYRRSLLLWTALFALAFLAVHAFWTLFRVEAEATLLPILAVLSGIGLVLMVALRDPLRDTLTFVGFAQGIALGAIALAIASRIDFTRMLGRLTWVPLIAAILISITLILFGSGPSGSDAKVNLLGVQPVEAVKILIVLFLAGYFARRWEFLRVLREQTPGLQPVSRWVEVPRLEYLLPLLAGVALTIVFFFVQKDLGPALVLSSLFLLLYAIARQRYLFAAVGFGAMLTAFWLGYLFRFPSTVADRVAMWLSPWDNAARGGEQIVHALWGMATGGLTGTGLGLGEPALMPAAHTDLILAALGEEFGFLGVATVALLLISLLAIGFRIARRASSDFGFFLATGLTLLLALEALLITGGVLDLVPLSGVAMPFLSFGKSAMIANFFILGMLVSLPSTKDPEILRPFEPSLRTVERLVLVLGVIVVGKALWIQVLRTDQTVGRGALTLQADGLRRYQYNPRLLAIARSIPRGTIYSSDGLPLATSDWAAIEGKRASFAKLGITLPAAPVGRQNSSSVTGDRYYPLGATAVHLLGDLRTRANWSATNSSLMERDSGVRLQGYDDRATAIPVRDGDQPEYYTLRYDYRELLPLLRHRHEPNHPDVRKVLDRERDVRTSIHAGLQYQASTLLRDHLKRLGKSRGSVVILDSSNGDLLASVSYPWPEQMPPRLTAPDSDETLLDRARYGLYPPGSTFKLVTALAALRKDPALARQTHECRGLPDGRVGNFIKGWSRPIRDDVADKTPHGNVDMAKGIVVSCNAYFAQLGTYEVGPDALVETAGLFNINVARPNTAAKLKDALPQAAYGQGQVVASPFQMARVAAAVANGGNALFGRWVVDETNNRVQPPKPVVSPALAAQLGSYMRGVVTSGTGRQAAGAVVPIAGKTGTAEIQGAPSHAWFVGYTQNSGRKLAFAILIENGQYGGSAAAPLAPRLVDAAARFGLLGAVESPTTAKPASPKR